MKCIQTKKAETTYTLEINDTEMNCLITALNWQTAKSTEMSHEYRDRVYAIWAELIDIRNGKCK